MRKSFELADSARSHLSLELDKEPLAFSGRLFEAPISFPPSYPFEESPESDQKYMTTRCPAWYVFNLTETSFDH